MLDGESLKAAVGKLIVTQNLPFLIVEAESFIELLKLCNPSVEKLLFKADTLTEHVMKIYWEGKEKIKGIFVKILYLSKISLTCLLWIYPNCKAILAITCHWTDQQWEQRELLLDVIEMREAHTGVNIGVEVVKTLADYGIREKLFCITADNGSVNLCMAKEISKQIPSFAHSQHLLGCTGHVFNLAAKDGLKALDYEPEPLVATDLEVDEFCMLTESDGWEDEYDEEEFASEEEVPIPKSVVDRVRIIVKAVRCSPQKRAKFEETVRVALPQLFVQPLATPRVSQIEQQQISLPSRPASKRIANSRFFFLLSF